MQVCSKLIQNILCALAYTLHRVFLYIKVEFKPRFLPIDMFPPKICTALASKNVICK